jgi:serine protease Do
MRVEQKATGLFFFLRQDNTEELARCSGVNGEGAWMGVMVVGQDGAARGSSPLRRVRVTLHTLRAGWILATSLATGCTGVSLGADPNQAVIDAVARALPAVVDVEVVAGGPAARVLGRERRGSGVVVTPQGYILTASHVVLGAESLRIIFPSGRQFSADVTAMDSESGLALLHISPFAGMVAAPLGSAADLRLGQLCIAVSSQGPDVRQVTTGVVSAFPSFEGYWEYRLDRAIQTDAVINPGSSGGPLLDAQGRVVGILSFSESDADRVNFAIPVDLITGVMDEMIQYGRIRTRAPRPWLGIYTVTTDRGVGVVAVTPGSPSERAGLRQRDLILQVNGVPVESRTEFYQAVWRGKIGDPFELILSRGEQSLSVVVVGGDREAFFPSPLQGRVRAQ